MKKLFSVLSLSLLPLLMQASEADLVMPEGFASSSSAKILYWGFLVVVLGLLFGYWQFVKVRRLNAWLRENGLEADFAGSFAYGDSKSDLPMLLLCGHPVQVNPKKALRKAAPEMDSEIWR